jgi:hypothetical protein
MVTREKSDLYYVVADMEAALVSIGQFRGIVFEIVEIGTGMYGKLYIFMC